MLETDDPLAIPLWINGHAYLTMAPTFLDVRNPVSGEILRRTPLCAAGEAQKAAEAAQAALPLWAAQTTVARGALLSALGDALAAYAGHFARLITEETGKEADAALAEVNAVVTLLHGAIEDGASGVVAIVSDDSAPLLGALSRAIPALLAGATLVLKPSPKAPSPVFAVAELTARSGFPDGVFNVLQGDEAAVEGLCASAVVSLLMFSGNAALGTRVGEIAARHGKRFAA
jgi:acyl-CoA reductase-like NAD-dependent aldehyde dehydrogenase